MSKKFKIKLPSRPRGDSSASWLALASVSLAAIACGGSELDRKDLGNTSASFDPSDRTAVIASDGSVDPFIVGHWVGQAEDLFSPPGPDGSRPPYTFPSGSTQITLDLPTPDSLSGQMVFGQGPVPDPATGVVYPPGVHPTGVDIASIPPLEGFAYTLHGPSTSAEGAVGVGYFPSESYRDWCPLQPARAKLDGSGTYDCITPTQEPAGAQGVCTDFEVGFPVVHYDCTLGMLCTACDCTGAGCGWSYNGNLVELWLVRSGDDLFGTFASAVFDYGQNYLPVGNVRFKRQPQ